MTKPKAPSHKTKTEPPSDSLPDAQAPSLAASYAQFLPVAQKIPAERIQPCRFDVNLIYANVQISLASLLPEIDRLKVELPRLHVERFTEHAANADALLYAVAQLEVSGAPIKREQLNKLLGRLRVLREAMLLSAESLALMEIIPMQRVEQIRRGQGNFDAAQDGVALADLFREFDSVVNNKHAFTTAHLTEIAEIGTAVMRAVTPAGARTKPNPALVAATEARDRLYTLLFERHADLRRAGAYLYGEEVDEKVPLLGARKGKSRSEAAPSEPGSAPTSSDAAGADVPR